MLGALILAASIWLALNMGGSGFAPALSAPLGAGLLSRRRAVLLFGACVVIGAALLGAGVARTLGGALVPAAAFDHGTTLSVIAAAAITLELANRIGIPQSTSWVTVAGVSVVGLAHGGLDTAVITRRLLPAWVLLPLLGFFLTYAAVRAVYPMRASNLRLYEWLPRRRGALRILVLASSCYVALAIGANNVANIVGPLSAARLVGVTWGLLLVAPLFGVGAALYARPSETVARGIAPLGLLTAAIVNVIVGSLLVGASLLGVPQSLVQLSTACVLAVSLVKEGSFALMDRRALRTIGLVWLVSPLLAALLTRLLLLLLP